MLSGAILWLSTHAVQPIVPDGDHGGRRGSIGQDWTVAAVAFFVVAGFFPYTPGVVLFFLFLCRCFVPVGTGPVVVPPRSGRHVCLGDEFRYPDARPSYGAHAVQSTVAVGDEQSGMSGGPPVLWHGTCAMSRPLWRRQKNKTKTLNNTSNNKQIWDVRWPAHPLASFSFLSPAVGSRPFLFSLLGHFRSSSVLVLCSGRPLPLLLSAFQKSSFLFCILNQINPKTLDLGSRKIIGKPLEDIPSIHLSVYL